MASLREWQADTDHTSHVPKRPHECQRVTSEQLYPMFRGRAAAPPVLVEPSPSLLCRTISNPALLRVSVRAVHAERYRSKGSLCHTGTLCRYEIDAQLVLHHWQMNKPEIGTICA